MGNMGPKRLPDLSHFESFKTIRGAVITHVTDEGTETCCGECLPQEHTAPKLS